MLCPWAEPLAPPKLLTDQCNCLVRIVMRVLEGQNWAIPTSIQ
jgi:hypothetical protein